MKPYVIVPVNKLPNDRQWLNGQAHIVIGVGDEPAVAADLIVPNDAAAKQLVSRIEQWPQAALVLVQALRANENLSVESALDVESLAYATLQAGSEFARWRETHPVADWPESEGEPLLLNREGNVMNAVLNRPLLRNSMTVDMREAWIAALDVLDADTSIECLHFSARGDCFSVGGE